VTSWTALSAALFNANGCLYYATRGGYFALAADLNPLLHTWSLSVEEQFYFAIPVSLVLAWRLGSRRRRSLQTVRVFVIALMTLSFAASLLITYRNRIGPFNGPRFAFFSPFTRAWEFALGLVLVLIPVSGLAPARIRRWIVAFGLGLIVLSSQLFSAVTLFPGAAAMLPVVGAALVIYGCTTADRVPAAPRTSASLRPMIWLGDLSYSWYLWHWPFIVFAAASWPNSGRGPLVLAAVLSLIPAWMSYRLVERRLRATAATRTGRTLVLAVCCIMASFVAFVVARPVRSEVAKQTTFAAFDRANERHIGARLGCGNSPPVGAIPAGQCTWNAAAATTSVELVGDSNALHFSEALIGAVRLGSASLQIGARFGCPFIDVILVTNGSTNTSCRDFVVGSMNGLIAEPRDVVVISNATDMYVDAERYVLVDPSTGERAAGQAKVRAFEAGLARVMARLRAAGSRVVVINDVPKPSQLVYDVRRCSAWGILRDESRCLFKDFTMLESQSLLRADKIESNAARSTGAEVWTFGDVICPAGLCRAERPVDGRVVWRDAQHISVATSETLVERTRQYLAAGK
jgi:peptidoglycan/LPS O-acetylase OafA/YrhL